MLASVAVIGWHRPVPVVRDDPPVPEGPEIADLVVDLVPARFEAWEPFVISWVVEEARPERVTPFEAKFGRHPCSALGSFSCRVRLAWDGVSRWSLTASVDETFDGRDARQLSTDGLFYGIKDGLLLGVLDTDRLPGLHVCHELAERRAAGEAVDGADSGAGVFVLERRGWGAASCLGPQGIPVGIDRGDAVWTMTELERRSPTDDEIGVQLVAGRAAFTPAIGCERPGRGAPEWLVGAARSAGHHDVGVAGGGIVFAVPGAWLRPGCAWVTADYLPVGARAHRLADGWVVDELLHPVPVVSAEVNGGRLWLAFTDDPPDARGARERDVFVLAEALRRLIDGV